MTMEEDEKPKFKSAYYAYAYEWRQEHKEMLKRLTYIELLHRIAADWAQLTPTDKIIYWERAGVHKSVSSQSKKRKVTILQTDEESEFSKPRKKKSRSLTNLSSDVADNLSDSDTFIQQKRRYRKRDKSIQAHDSEQHRTSGRRRASSKDHRYDE